MGTATASVRWTDGGIAQTIRNCIWSAIVDEGRVAPKPNESPTPAAAPALTDSYRRVVIADQADAPPTRDLKAILGV